MSTANTFNYKHGKKTIALPKFNKLPFGAIRKMRKADSDDQAFILFEEAASDAALEIIDTMGVEDVGKLIEAWQKDSDVSVGE